MPRYEVRNHFLFIDGKQVPYLPSPNRSGPMVPLAIIDHDTASNPLSPDGDIGWLRMPRAGASAHVVIDWRGNIVQLVPFNIQAWHAGASAYGSRRNYNDFSIGIEHDNPGYLRKVGEGVYQGVCVINTNTNPAFYVQNLPAPNNGPKDLYWLGYSQAQLEASTQLHIALKAAYPTINEVLAHWHICPGRKTDTNPLFPLGRMQSIIRGNAQSMPTKPQQVAEVINDPKTEAGVPAGGLTAGYVANSQANAAMATPMPPAADPYTEITNQLTTLSYQGLAVAGKILMVLGLLFALWVIGKYAWQGARAVWRYFFPPKPPVVEVSDYEPVVYQPDDIYAAHAEAPVEAPTHDDTAARNA